MVSPAPASQLAPPCPCKAAGSAAWPKLSRGCPPHPAVRPTGSRARKLDGLVFRTESGLVLAGLGGGAAGRSFVPTDDFPVGPGPAEALLDSLGGSVSVGHANSCTPGVFSALPTVPVQVLTVHLFWIRDGESACCKDVSGLQSVALDSDFGQNCNFGMLEPNGPSPAPAAHAYRQNTGRDAGRAGHSPRLAHWHAKPR